MSPLSPITPIWKQAYFEYLTEGLDSGESKNIVVPTVSNLCCQKLKFKKRIKVLDIGCFSGAMLNRVRLNLPSELRNRIDFIGADVDKNVLTTGANKYQHITFILVNIKGNIPLIRQYDIVIVSNVLHEIFSGAESQKNGKVLVRSTLKKIGGLLCVNGNLVILDGLRPEHNNRPVVIKFQSPDAYNLYKLFADKYSAILIKTKKLSKKTIGTKLGHLAAFLTKARYLNEKYWENESKQLYQFFTADEFQEALEAGGMVVERLEPQPFPHEQINQIVESVEPNIDLPVKNVLIVAQIQKPSQFD